MSYKINGIIFDFNGTLFWDSKMHDKAWNEFAIKHRGKELTPEDLLLRVHGKINKDILAFVFGRELTIDEALKFSEEKEELYREIVTSSKQKYSLAEGAEKLLDQLSINKIPFTIATSSEKSNVDFYYEYLELHRWFDYDKIVYENGQMKPKPDPDIFLIAANKIGIPIEECMILEDSYTGIKAARSSGAVKVLFVENDVPVSYKKVKPLVDGRIKNLMDLMDWLG